MDFNKIAYALHDLSCTSSRTAKTGILRKLASEPGFKDVLKHLYNPYVTTGIKQAKLDNAWYQQASDEVSTEEVLEYFKVTRTGSDEDVQFALLYLSQFSDPVELWAAEGIITKDLQCGVSATTLNQVYGKGFIPIIGIMRGALAPASFNGCYIATEKIDGNRRLFFNFADRVEVYTRSGHRDYNLKELEAEFQAYLPKGYMYDCECVAEGTFEDNIALRQASASILNSSGVKTGVCAKAFDMVPIEQYNDGESLKPAIERKLSLAVLFRDEHGIKKLLATGLTKENDYETAKKSYMNAMQATYRADLCKHIEALPILGIVHSKREAMKVVAPIWERHGEGVMLVDAVSHYKVSATPSRAWLKIKNMSEVIAKVIDVVEGTNRLEGALGSVTIAFLGPDKKVYTCNVGSGFADYQRTLFYNEPDKIVGKMIEIECQGFSKAKDSDDYSLNCPIFKRVHGQND